MVVRVQGVEEVVSQVVLPACSYPWRWRVFMGWSGRCREAEVEGNTNVCCALCPGCVDKIDPSTITDMPGVCVTRVDCGGRFGSTCPALWKCSASGSQTGYCVYDFAAAARASSSSKPSGTAQPSTPTGVKMRFVKRA